MHYTSTLSERVVRVILNHNKIRHLYKVAEHYVVLWGVEPIVENVTDELNGFLMEWTLRTPFYDVDYVETPEEEAECRALWALMDEIYNSFKNAYYTDQKLTLISTEYYGGVDGWLVMTFYP
nr:MAG TPA: hypothetical protein [Caudoviricetes sp.]